MKKVVMVDWFAYVVGLLLLLVGFETGRFVAKSHYTAPVSQSDLSGRVDRIENILCTSGLWPAGEDAPEGAK
jgi:hypothetical protein